MLWCGVLRAVARPLRSSVPQQPEEVALADVVLAAFPTATFTFFRADSSAKPALRRRPSSSTEQALHGGLSSSQSREEALLSTPRDHLQVGAAHDSLWSDLHRWYLPKRGGSRPGSYARCRFLVGASTVTAATTTATPLWTPHAVVHIGGFDGGDLRAVILPSLVEHLPALPEELRQRVKDTAGNRVATVQGQRRPPMYCRKRLLEQEAFQEKGCAAYGSSLLELSLVPPDTGSDTRRERVFLLLADAGVTVAELLREPQLSRRSVLRSAFGVSLPLLQQSLPAPVALAVMVVREWERATGFSEASSAFWVSALAHYLVSRRAEDVLAPWVPEDKMQADTWQRLKAKLSVSSSSSSSSGAFPSPEQRSSVEEECCLALCLASSVVQWAAMCGDDVWDSVLLRNFFLPAEDFSEAKAVQALSSRRASWAARGAITGAVSTEIAKRLHQTLTSSDLVR